MNPDQQQPTQPDPTIQKVYNPLSVMREDEQVICEIKRHPIGIIGVYLGTVIVVVGVLAAALIVPGHISNVTQQDKAELLFGALIVSVIALLYAYIARIIYTGNRWILTDDSLTQVTQDGLFRKHSSQLSLANLEDITADQNGVVQTMFGYGVLKAETAGERSKFMFLYCPNPNEYARKILQARESFIMNDPDAAKRANDKLMTPGMATNFAPPQPVSQPPQPLIDYSAQPSETSGQPYQAPASDPQRQPEDPTYQGQ